MTRQYFKLIFSVSVGFSLLVAIIIYTPMYATTTIPTDSVGMSHTLEISDRKLLPQEQPKRLIIPALDIDATVQHVGVTSGGAMATPRNFHDVAWYKHGTIPGEKGSAVIVGHVDNAFGLAGVFKNLGKLTIGDDVYVLTKDGTRLHFVVTASHLYKYKEVPVEEIFNDTEGVKVRLITCAGNWIRSEKTYDTRLVITAEFKSE
jgi:sortase A